MKNLGTPQCSVSVRCLPDSRSLFSVKDVIIFDLVLDTLQNHSVGTVSLNIGGNLGRRKTCLFLVLPPSVVMSQKTFRCFPSFAGSIQYFPFTLHVPLSRMSLQDFDAKVKITC